MYIIFLLESKVHGFIAVHALQGRMRELLW